MMEESLILASASPRRSDLLDQVGVAFERCPSEFDEGEPGDNPLDYAARMALGKAQEVALRMPGRVVLGADTVVVLGDETLGKPRDPAEAREMLGRLSGREHIVITAFCIVRGEDVLHQETVTTKVEFKALRSGEIHGYVLSGEPMDKAGAYGAQGLGMFLIRRVEGSYANVVGLPVCEVVEALERLGILDLFGSGTP